MAMAILVFRGTIPDNLMLPPYWWGSRELWECVTFSDINTLPKHGKHPILGHYPPAQNQYMQEKFLGELIFARMHAGPVLALARIQENTFEGSFSAY